MNDFSAILAKMTTAKVAQPAIDSFQHNYEALVRNESGLIPEEAILPATDLPNWDEIVTSCPNVDEELLGQCVVIKLNGGLGTSMGLQAAKSLLDVREGINFLDIMVKQILFLRESSGKKVRLLLMNSFSTSEDTLQHLLRYKANGLSTASEVELMQNQAPKLDAATLQPASWPQDPELEWCPPGHGDLYPALLGSGWLEKLFAAGVKYAFVSNSDNLGAVLEPALLQYFANSGSPFLMEVTRRTPADKKGGHLAVRKSDGQLLLREVAQCPSDDLEAFQDINTHQYFNTNNLWLRLDVLMETLQRNKGILPLPMIVNRKTIDPRDKNSTPVIQLEVAMGAAIECFQGASAIEIPRSRFAPVKTTADLFCLRSDAYVVGNDGRVMLHPDRKGVPPNVVMDDHYKLVDSIAAIGMPSLIECGTLKMTGLLNFADGVIIRGNVSFVNTSNEPVTISAGTYENTDFSW